MSELLAEYFRLNRADLSIPDAGADEYLTKLMQPDRFLARVRAVLRRAAL